MRFVFKGKSLLMAVSFHPHSKFLPVGSKPPGKGYRIADTNDPHRVAKCMSEYLWAGNIWRDGHRLKANFLYSDWCLLDIDDSYHEYPIEQATSEFCDKIHIIGATRNHRKSKDGVACDRYRIAVPWETRITKLSHYEGNMHRLYSLMRGLDQSTLHGAQPFFRCTEIVSFSAEGYKQDVFDVHKEDDRECGEELRKEIAAKRLDLRMRGRLPAWVTHFLKTGVADPGQRHFKSLGAAIELAEYGLSCDAIVTQLEKAPISRAYRRGETLQIARYAIKDVEARLHGEAEDEAEDQQGAHLPSSGEGAESHARW